MPNFPQSFNKLKHDATFVWRPGRIYIPAWQFAGVAYEATTGNAIKSIGTGTPDATNLALNEVNTSGITGMLLKTTDNSVNHLMQLPGDFDPSKPMHFQVYWTSNNTTGSVDWEMFYKVFIPGTTVLGTAEAATAMDVVGAAQTSPGVAYTVSETPRMSIYGGKIAETTTLIQLTVQMHALVTITLPFFLGLGVIYTPRRLWGPDGMTQEAKAPTFPVGKTYAN